MSVNLKRFNMQEKEDSLFVLKNLYSNIYRNILSYSRYCDEMVELYQHYSSTNENIPAEVYDDIKNKAQNVSRLLLIFVADNQSDSMSYMMFRKLFKKMDNGIDLDENEKLDSDLLELLKVRNATFHNPQSIFVSEKIVLEKERDRLESDFLSGFPDEWTKFLIPTIDYRLLDIHLPHTYHPDNLASLALHTSERLKIYLEILQQIEKDYTTILGVSVKVEVFKEENVILFSDGLAIANLSMAIQQRKYKDEENYDEVTMKSYRDQHGGK